jgi:hypothetical protein
MSKSPSTKPEQAEEAAPEAEASEKTLAARRS